jgi:hypothetical protein
MAKADGLGAWAGGDNVADLDVALRYDDAVDEQLDQLASLLEGRAGQSGLDALAERLDGAHHAGDPRLAIGLRRELLPLADEPLALLLKLAPAPLILRERHDGPEIGRRQPLQLPVELALAAAEVLLARSSAWVRLAGWVKTSQRSCQTTASSWATGLKREGHRVSCRLWTAGALPAQA